MKYLAIILSAIIFPEYSSTDKIYHMNVQLLGKNSHGKYVNPKYIFRSADGKFYKNYHLNLSPRK